MKTRLLSIFFSAAALFAGAVQPAFGTFIAPTVAFTYGTSGLNVAGCAPGISSVLGSKQVNLGAAQTYNLFTVAPAGSCPGNYASETLSVTFTVTGVSNSTSNNVETGLYTAKYTGTVLPCAATDPASTHGQSDCVNWDPAHRTIEFALLGADAGFFLDITLNDAIDWNIVPTVSYQVVDAPTLRLLPEPGTLALLGLGLVGLAASRRRKQ